MSEKRVAPLKAIRTKCLDCCCGSAHEVKMCPCLNCSLYPFRMGADPYRKKREYSEEQRAVLAARLRRNTSTNTGRTNGDLLS